MGKLVFLYTTHGATPFPGSTWNNSAPSDDPYTRLIATEGYFFLIKELLRQKIISEALLVVESSRSPGYFEQGGIKGYAVPHIADIDPFVNPDDIIWARGGFRSWHDYMIDLQERGHWLMFYAANTGRERWTFWDIILDDLTTTFRYDRHNRFWVPFIKPMNEDIFYPKNIDKKWDICIGASHIHDKKGQYRVFKALDYLHKKTGRTFKCVLPGSLRGGAYTRRWLTPEVFKRLNIEFIGMVPREQLTDVFNQSHLFCYMGTGGQGDRGPLEAMACGTPLLIGETKRLAPSAYNNSFTNCVYDYDNPKKVASAIEETLSFVSKRTDIKKKVHEYYIAANGLQKAVDCISPYIRFMQENPRQNKYLLKVVP